jgi:demethylmacrocin O-methyltransferase
MSKTGVKNFLKLFISKKQRKNLRDFQHYIYATLSNNKNLNELGRLYRTDKIDSHCYTQHYMTHLQKIRKNKINLLEIGVGGYDNPNLGGHSLRMWKKYFPHGKIYGLDIYDKSALQERRITLFKGSQIDTDFLAEVIKATGELDIIIDDGSHINEHIIETFKILFPKLKQGGIYIAEDLQTSYWPDMGGG